MCCTAASPHLPSSSPSSLHPLPSRLFLFLHPSLLLSVQQWLMGEAPSDPVG